MSNRTSKTTRVLGVRMPLDLYEILERRAKNHRAGKSGYALDRLAYDLTRKHTKHKEGTCITKLKQVEAGS